MVRLLMVMVEGKLPAVVASMRITWGGEINEQLRQITLVIRTDDCAIVGAPRNQFDARSHFCVNASAWHDWAVQDITDDGGTSANAR